MTGYPERPRKSLQPFTYTREEPTNGLPIVETPHRLLWATAIIASVLCIVAFMLWGTHGPVLLFDMIVALCT